MIQRGEIYLAKLSPVVGSEQGGIRPVVIVQNNKGNRFSPTVIVAAITSSKTKPNLPTHIRIMPEESGLKKPSIILLEQIRTLDKSRLIEKIGCLAQEKIQAAKKTIDKCKRVICCRENFGSLETFQRELLEYAEQLGKQIEKSERPEQQSGC